MQFWANLADPKTDDFADEVATLSRNFPEIFEDLGKLGLESEGKEQDFFKSVWGLREHLRKVWLATDTREREWYLHEIRRLHVQHLRVISNREAAVALEAMTANLLPGKEQFKSDLRALAGNLARSGRFWGWWIDPPPPLTTFERVMYHFQHIAHRAKHCENQKCEAPFFFLKHKGQRFCKPECALLAQRKAKSDWWKRNREQQIKKRKLKRALVRKINKRERDKRRRNRR